MKAEELIEQVRDLPTLSPSTLKLVSMLNNPEHDNETVVKLVRCDLVLSLKLLRACNSAAFALRAPVASVEQAVLLLGYEEIYRLVLSISFGGALSRDLPGYAIESKELWRHSLITALSAQLIAARDRPVPIDPAMAYTAGLVHDIGKLALSQVLSPELRAAVHEKVAEGGLSLVEAERAVLETDHGEAGACLLQKWNLPEPIVEATAHHHQPVVQPVPKLSAVVHVANCVAHEVGSAPGLDSYAVRTNESAAEALGIGIEEFERILIDTHEALGRLDAFAGMP